MKYSKQKVMQLFLTIKHGCKKEKHAHCKDNSCHVDWEEPTKLVLGENGSNYSLHHESNIQYYNSWDDIKE